MHFKNWMGILNYISTYLCRWQERGSRGEGMGCNFTALELKPSPSSVLFQTLILDKVLEQERPPLFPEGSFPGCLTCLFLCKSSERAKKKGEDDRESRCFGQKAGAPLPGSIQPLLYTGAELRMWILPWGQNPLP